MKKRDIRFASIPSTEEVAAERERLAYQNRYQRVLRSTVYILVVVAAAAVLLFAVGWVLNRQGKKEH